MAECLSIKQSAAYIGISKRTLYAIIERGDLVTWQVKQWPSCRKCAHIVIEDLDEYQAQKGVNK